MRKTTRQKAPLKKIVSQHADEYGRTIEVLECGHEQPRLQDHYGPTNAYRRRCLKCLREKVGEADHAG